MTEKERADPMDPMCPAPFRVEECLVLPSLNRIECGQVIHQIEPRVMRVLVCLAARPSEVISRQTLFDVVWADSVVCEEALTRTISELRRVFQDDSKTPRVIETIRKGGYRLIAPVTPVSAQVTPGLATPSAPAAPALATTSTPVAPASRPASEPAAPALVQAPEPSPEPDPAAPGAPALASVQCLPPPQVEPSRSPTRPGLKTARLIGVWGLAIVTISIGCFWGVKRFIRTTHSTPVLTEPRPLTSFPGLELFPALSPDGSMVAFSWAGENAADGMALDIYVMRIQNGSPVRLTSLPEVECFPSWSPDGSEIAFSVETRDGPEIRTVPVLGGGSRRMATFEFSINGLDWSPDGRSIAYAAADSSSPVSRIHLLSLENLSRRVLTSPPRHCQGDIEPALSPDGRRLAFIRINELQGRDAYSVPIEGGEPRKQDMGGARVSGLAWLSERAMIVSAASKIDYSLWKVPSDSGERLRLSIPGGRIQRVAMARTGRRLAYEKISFARNIWCADISNAGVFRRRAEPLIASTQRESEPVFSPDGRSIAFVSDRSGSPEIWIADAAGGHPQKLTNHQATQMTRPRWSPDGTQIAYSCNADGPSSIYVTERQSLVARRLLQDGTQILAVWSRQGDDLYYQADAPGGWEVWRMHPDGSGCKRISEAGYTIIDESSDGRGLFCLKSDEPGIWLLPVDGSQRSLVVRGEVCGDWQEAIAAKDGLYFTRRGPESSTLGFYDLATGRSDSLASLEWYAASLALSPDRSALLYDCIRDIEVDLVLAEVNE